MVKKTKEARIKPNFAQVAEEAREERLFTEMRKVVLRENSKNHKFGIDIRFHIEKEQGGTCVISISKARGAEGEEVQEKFEGIDTTNIFCAQYMSDRVYMDAHSLPWDRESEDVPADQMTLDNVVQNLYWAINSLPYNDKEKAGRAKGSSLRSSLEQLTGAKISLMPPSANLPG